MKRKLKFETPTVLRAVDLSLEGGILLKGSIVDQIEIVSAGQEVHEYDADSDEFDWNSQWDWEN